VTPRRDRGSRFRAALLALCLAGAAGADERGDVEAQLADIARDIEALQDRLERDRGQLNRERGELERLDRDIQDTARTLAEVAADLETQRKSVRGLEQERDAYLAQLGEREDALGRQILAAWELSRASRLKLVLNQDDPARVGRLLAYYELIGEAQGARIEELRAALARLEGIQEALDRELATLDGIQKEHERRRERLQAQRQERLALVASLERSLADDAARLDELRRNRADLETILERLGDALADIPADLGQRRHPAEQRGQLPMPVGGRVLQAFGQPRAAGLVWQGWLIAAPAGEAVRAVAYGRVAYADWLRGYGLLIIVDHGDGFMSLYGHNESLRAEVGDWVEPGEVIATVGRGPEQRQGLYFELRREGRAVDPAAWVNR